MSDIEKRARELLVCPFCGGDAAIRNWQDEELWSHAIVEWQKVHCTECECEGISSCPGYEPDTVQVWNTRAALTPPEGYVLVPVAVAKDAERYQWLRAKAGDSPEEFEVVADAAFAAHYGCPENLDINIDAAMLAARPDVP